MEIGHAQGTIGGAETFDQRCHPFRFGENDIQILAPLAGKIFFLLQQEERVLDGLQRVVQFVRDRSKQAPHKRQPFTLDQLRTDRLFLLERFLQVFIKICLLQRNRQLVCHSADQLQVTRGECFGWRLLNIENPQKLIADSYGHSHF